MLHITVFQYNSHLIVYIHPSVKLGFFKAFFTKLLWSSPIGFNEIAHHVEVFSTQESNKNRCVPDQVSTLDVRAMLSTDDLKP